MIKSGKKKTRTIWIVNVKTEKIKYYDVMRRENTEIIFFLLYGTFISR